MLSNPTTQARQRQHRRQNSTPSAFEAVKIAPNLPNNMQSQHRRQHMAHRRGMSLDTRRPMHHRQDSSSSMGYPPTVSNTTSDNTNNTGLATNPQHVLREAQQQRIARPGNPQHNFQSLPHSDEAYLISPHATPHAQRFDQSLLDPIPVSFDMYTQQHMASTPSSKDFDLFSPDSALSTPTFLSFGEGSSMAHPMSVQGWISDSEANNRRSSRRISNGIMDRVAKFETMGMEGDSNSTSDSRPTTPPTQNGQSRFSAGAEYRPQMVPVSNTVQGYMPPTPLETPQERHGQPQTQQQQQQQQQPHGQFASNPSRFSEGYDESMEETIKPNKNKRQRAQDLFADMPPLPDGSQIPPQHHQQLGPAPVTMGFDSVSMPAGPDFQGHGATNNDMIKMERGVQSLSVSPVLPQHPSPQTPQAGQFHATFDNKPDLFHPNMVHSGGASPSRSLHDSRGDSLHRRTESLASIASAASIAGINIEETKTETGVTMDDIATYIEGPDPTDNKWLCLYESCGKKFGRKENIKSHVQTHLNDRQYQCPTCKKCFVRQHDLKRHAKIHTGIKPYPCECGNSFARHDALTRHRQRGMCIGAFDGIVRKVVKRGRPRKNRPDIDSRLDKSARTRKRNESTSSVSSQSGCSDTSAPNSPQNFNDLEMLDEAPFVEAVEVTGSHTSPSSSATVNPNMNQGLRYASLPQMASMQQQPVASPSAMSNHSHHSVAPGQLVEVQTIDPAALPSHPGSPSKSVASHYNTPPELSQSSSPPCTTATHFFDVDANTSSSTSTESSLAALTTTTALEDQMLLQAWADGGDGNSLVNLDRDSGILMMNNKFEEDYETAVNMFTEGGDVFFGSS
ncbi:hypothetical protein MKZ38_000742 [Zalerion maritima]|uniref:pH-response transcription factor pacC/RIM101 n=1 Tax=Zalerion maritima TaxID=339359 RepID=A0AAD5RR23_9PEZI|nr:hypothetical protein MKZ38_000742 [Zalerion maritima]